MEQIQLISISLYIFFLCSTISNAGYSISFTLVGIFAIYYLIRKTKEKHIQFPDKFFLYIYVIFFGSLFLAALLLGDWNSILGTSNYFYLSLPFWGLYFLCNANKKCENFIQVGQYMAAFVLSCYSIYQFCTVPLGNRIGNFFASPNTFAMIIEIFFPFMVAGIVKIFKRKEDSKKYVLILYTCIIVSGMIGFSLLVTQSRGGIASIIVGFVALCLVKYLVRKNLTKKDVKIVVFGILFAAIVGSIFAFTITSFHRSYDKERVLLIKSTYQMWQDHKLYGVGFNNWQKEYKEKYISPEAKEPDLPLPHNTFASFFSRTGVIGGIGYTLFSFGLFYFLVRELKKNPNNVYIQAMLWTSVAIFSHGMVDAGINTKYVMRLFFAYIGITIAMISIDKGMSDNSENAKTT